MTAEEKAADIAASMVSLERIRERFDKRDPGVLQETVNKFYSMFGDNPKILIADSPVSAILISCLLAPSAGKFIDPIRHAGYFRLREPNEESLELECLRLTHHNITSVTRFLQFRRIESPAAMGFSCAVILDSVKGQLKTLGAEIGDTSLRNLLRIEATPTREEDDFTNEEADERPAGTTAFRAASQYLQFATDGLTFSYELQGESKQSVYQKHIIDYTVALREMGFLWSLMLEKVVILVRPPTALHTRHPVPGRHYGMLSNENGPAVEFKDGAKVWAVNGFRCPWQVIDKPELIDASAIVRERNSELRRIMVERYGAVKFLRQCTLIERTPLGALYSYTLERNSGQYDRLEYRFLYLKNSTPEPDGSFKHYVVMVQGATRTVAEGLTSLFPVATRLGIPYNPDVES